jgi:hypothetical protein
MLNKVVDILTSLKLTVICLTLALGLVFIGTLAQVSLGLYIVQEQYFGSYIAWPNFPGTNIKFPYPGGYLIGGVLLINLIAAHIQRFELSKKKFGIFVIHAGLILLLVGQLLTQLFQVESYMAIEEGDTKNYSESGRLSEIAIIDVTDTNENTVVAIPQQILADNKEIRHASLPFTVKVQSFYENADPNLQGSKLSFVEKSFQVAMNKRNIPAANVEIITDEGTKGPFALSNWQTEKNLIKIMAESFSSSFNLAMIEPGSFSYKGRQYEIAMRPKRYYKDFSIELLDFTHDRYLGTEIPKNFSSRVRLINPTTKENREVLIYMNNPLRYGGETYYQGGFEPGDTITILQVVRNPSWLTPYIACALVSFGLLFQFLFHLVGFAKKRLA